MVEPSPWSVIDTNESNINSVIETSATSNESNNTPAAFEDNFSPAESTKTIVNESLPDSKEYIQVLGTLNLKDSRPLAYQFQTDEILTNVDSMS